jgi:hypothetical protein
VRAPPLLYYILNADAKKRRERVHVNFFSRSIVYERPQSHEPGRLSHISTAPRDEGFPDASKGRDHLLAAFALLFALATGSGRGPHGRRQRGARDAGAAGHAGPNGRLLSSWTSSRDPCVLAPSGDSKALHANPSAPTSTSGLCAACRQAVWCPQLLCSDAVWGGIRGRHLRSPRRQATTGTDEWAVRDVAKLFGGQYCAVNVFGASAAGDWLREGRQESW